MGCGILDIYVSTTDPKPGPAVFDNRYRATPSSPAVLTLTETLPEGTPVYITVVGTRLPPSAASLANCSDYSWSIGVAPKKGQFFSVCLSLCLYVCLPACLSVCLSIYLSGWLVVCLSVCLSACLPACLPDSLSLSPNLTWHK